MGHVLHFSVKLTILIYTLCQCPHLTLSQQRGREEGRRLEEFNYRTLALARPDQFRGQSLSGREQNWRWDDRDVSPKNLERPSSYIDIDGRDLWRANSYLTPPIRPRSRPEKNYRDTYDYRQYDINAYRSPSEFRVYDQRHNEEDHEQDKKVDHGLEPSGHGHGRSLKGGEVSTKIVTQDVTSITNLLMSMYKTMDEQGVKGIPSEMTFVNLDKTHPGDEPVKMQVFTKINKGQGLTLDDFRCLYTLYFFRNKDFGFFCAREGPYGKNKIVNFNSN